MKKAVILHRWSGTPESDWYSWLKSELESKGFEVSVPTAPNTDHPIIEERMRFMDQVMETIDESTLFVCHSIGCQTLMRYLASHNKKVGQVIFIAGWFNLQGVILQEGEDVQLIAKPWIETPINLKQVKNSCKSIKVLLSSNEPYGCVVENKKLFEQSLNAQVIVLENKGHFTEDDGITQIPEILDFIE